MSGLWVEISFRQPLWLLFVAQPIVLLLLRRLLAVSRSVQYSDVQYSDVQLRPWTSGQTQSGNTVRYVRLVLLFMAWLMFAIAMAGPRLPETMADHQTSSQRELMVLLDMSPSMAARDVQPNRLERAKLEILDLIQRMQGTRMGIIVYGAQAHLLSPMTQDKNVLRHYVNAIRTGQLPTLGSRLERAIDLAGKQFDTTHTTPRALLIISDGEHHTDSKQQQTLERRIATLKQQGVQVYALGVGTTYGAPIMAEDQGWLKYEGQSVNSRLQTAQLQRLSQLGNGRYSNTLDNNRDWQQLYDEGIGQLKPVTQQHATELIIWQELYHWFVITGVICLLLGLWQPGKKHTTQTTTLALLLLITSGVPHESYAVDDSYHSAYVSLKAEHYPHARAQFSRLSGFRARLGEGSAAYYMQDYKAAAQQFTQAVLDATNDQQRGDALFNMANAQYQLADYHTAARLYADVLNYLPQHKGALINLEYARALQSEEVKSDRTAHRAGRGAQIGSAPEGMSTEGVRGITLGDDEEEQAFIPPDVLSTDVKTPAVIQQATPASRKVDRDTDADWQYRISSLEQLQQEKPHVESNTGQFWQRLFEHEEGFMAPVEQAHRLPKVKPW